MELEMFSSRGSSSCGHDLGRRHSNERIAHGTCQSRGNLIVDKRDYIFHLLLQLLHLFPHVENDFHAGEIDAELAGKSQYDLKPLEIILRIEPGIPVTPGRLQ
jgi:hypothetical protein